MEMVLDNWAVDNPPYVPPSSPQQLDRSPSSVSACTMDPSYAKPPALAEKMFSLPRTVMLIGSVLVALSSGTNYIYSAYAPQLGARLRVSHVQLNVIGLAGNLGVYLSGPVWGRIVDRKGPRIPLIGASVTLFFGYLGIKKMYDDGIGEGETVSALHLALLVICNVMTGLGGSAGLCAAMSTTAKSFPASARATTTGLVISGFGLSAFFFSLIAHTFFPGDTSALLLILAIGTVIPMVIGPFIVKPVPLPPTSYNSQQGATSAGYDPIASVDAFVFVGEPQGSSYADADRAPLLSHNQEQSLEHYSVPSSTNPPQSLHHDIDGDKEGLPDIHGKRLLLTPDFYLVCMIMTICSGTGLMYINNVGSISQALYAAAHPVYDKIEASKWQAAQVSILSLGNFAGRILIGLTSDFTHTRLRMPRAYCFCIVSFLFIISQATVLTISSVEALWIATLALGIAYGSLFGSCPTVMIEWFGLAHFTENWGYIACSPAVAGNLFSLMFGYNLDAHARNPDPNSSLGRRAWSWVRLMSRELPSEHQCFDGKMCYVASLKVTLVACIIALGLSWWAGVREGEKIRNRYARVGGQNTI